MNPFVMDDAQLLFETPPGGLAPSRSEARSVLRNQFESRFTAIEVVADFLAVVLAVSGAFFAYQLWRPGSILRSELGAVSFVSFAIAGLVVLLLDRDGAYVAGNSLLRIKETERSLRVSFQALLLVLLAVYATGGPFAPGILFIALFSVPLFQIVEKQLLLVAVRVLRARGIGVRNVLIYGAGESGRRIFSALIRSPKLGLNPVAIIDDDGDLEGNEIFESSYKREHSVRVISGRISRELIEEYRCELLVIAIPSLAYERFCDAAQAAWISGTLLAFLPRKSAVSAEKIEYTDIDGTMLNVVRRQTTDRNYEIAKRLFDLVVALALLPIATPFMVIIALLVHFDSPGEVLFRQARSGRNGKPFTMYKFRSMHSGVPKFAVSPRDGMDPRITRIGRFLRRSSLDEMPQLINVVKGEMSLVGPRPEMPFIAQQYNSEQRKRLDVPPGITCLWQLSADRRFHIHENIQYDLYYIQYRSILMDFAILLHTMVFAMRGV